MKNLANFKTQIRTREYLIQAIYQYFFNNQEISDIVNQFKDEHKNKKVDFDTFSLSLESIKNNESEFKEILDSMNVKDSNMDLIDKSILYFLFQENPGGTIQLMSGPTSSLLKIIDLFNEFIA